jgi:tRNA threonylcarbamoyl adenosine modification protein (Sua5/YciO/YrdC/YwlC family)
MTLHATTAETAERERGLVAAVAALRRGQLVGLPLDAGYGLAADPFNERGVEALRRAKGRADLTVPVMVPRMATVAGIALVDAAAKSLMAGFWPGPLTLVLPVQPTLAWSLAEGTGLIAVRQPLHPVALELLSRTGPLGAVAAAPGATDPGEAFADGLDEHLAVLLDAGTLPGGPPSAVVDLSGTFPVLVRPGPLAVADLVAACPDIRLPEG